jgi:hypothetical protein
MRFPQTETKTVQAKEKRMQIYSCDFCQFIQSSLELAEGEEESRELMDGAFEAKYLFHIRTVHGLEK